MSFRHTAITEFLYKHDRQDILDEILAVLQQYGNFHWHSNSENQYGYFHGVIRDLDDHETREQEEQIIRDIHERTGARLKIVYENELTPPTL